MHAVALGLSLAAASNKSCSVWAERAVTDYHNDDRGEGGDVMLYHDGIVNGNRYNERHFSIAKYAAETGVSSKNYTVVF